jgi:hypothetical protein
MSRPSWFEVERADTWEAEGLATIIIVAASATMMIEIPWWGRW